MCTLPFCLKRILIEWKYDVKRCYSVIILHPSSYFLVCVVYSLYKVHNARRHNSISLEQARKTFELFLFEGMPIFRRPLFPVPVVLKRRRPLRIVDSLGEYFDFGEPASSSESETDNAVISEPSSGSELLVVPAHVHEPDDERESFGLEPPVLDASHWCVPGRPPDVG